MTSKEAVCVIIDGNTSMAKLATMPSSSKSTSTSSLKSTDEDNSDNDHRHGNGAQHDNDSDNFRDTTTDSSRFDVAKGVAIDFISSLMIRSKTHEVSVFVLNTKKTRHHLYSKDSGDNEDEESDDDEDDDIDFPHILEISGNGYQDELRPPWPGLLRRINGLTIPAETEVETSESKSETGRRSRYFNNGGIISGITLAADALHRRTAGKKFHRRIIAITDAEQEIKLENPKEVLLALDKLREMECELQVVGFDFGRTSDYIEVEKAPGPPIKSEPSVDGRKNNGDNNNNRNGSDSDTDVAGDEDDDESEDEDVDNRPVDTKERNENLIHKLTSRTGGYVFSANDKKSLVNKIWGNKIVKSSKKKLDFEIAPGLVLENIRCYLMIGATKMPTLKTKIATASEDGKTTVHNSLGDEMVQDFVSKYEFWKADDDGIELVGADISEAYRFGSDYIPYNPLDELGLSSRSSVKLAIRGYMSAETVTHSYLMGEPYILSGVDSRRSCAAISALAQALHRCSKVALATFVKTRDKDPVLMGVFPFMDDDKKKGGETIPIRLMMIQLPFMEEMKDIDLSPLDNFAKAENPRVDSACDNLIDSMMLHDDVLDYTRIDNPSIDSFYSTIVERTIDRKATLIAVEVDDGRNKLDETSNVMKKKALNDFEKVLPRKEASNI
mmetsp:Transcript_43490/g.105427  ORF Transcript_43490/g.105427 Transcript_43490/m.105427 type:complete len:669 (+) Transcript_43490:73-2079(+)